VVAPSRSADALAAYEIGQSDVLEISVFEVPELARTVEVAENGTISVPLLGEVPVAGKTVREIERDLAKKLEGKYLRSRQVTVNVKEFNSQRVTVDGTLRQPGLHALNQNNTQSDLTSVFGPFLPQNGWRSTRLTPKRKSKPRLSIHSFSAGLLVDDGLTAGAYHQPSHSVDLPVVRAWRPS